MRIEVLLDLKTRLGESPVWDVEQQRLWWVDSLDGRLFACNAQGGAIKSWDVRQKIGSFALRQSGEGAVVALQNGVHLLDFASGELTLLHHPEADRPFNRLNDGKVDRQGRFLFGSMDMREEEPSGALYRLDADLSLHVLKKDIIVSNAPCWSPSGETFYFADTWTGEICAWDYNTATGDHTPAGEQRGKKRLIHRFSWVSLLVCWLIWVLNAYDREMILRLGPVISKEFSLSPEQWGNIVALIMVALAVLDIPGSIWSDRYGSGWKRARFQVPLVLGYTALSFISGIKAISHGLTAFVLLRVGVNLGAGWGEPVGVSNTAEWWPKEKRGFALGVHHTGYPIGALLSGVVASLVLATFGEGSWRYCFLLALLVAIPLMIFWAKYSTADRINTLYQHIDSQGLTRPATQESSHVAKGEGMKTFLRTLRNRNISLTAGNTLLTQIVYMGINVVLPPYLYHVSGLSLAASAGLSIIFTLTGTLGQVIWPWLSDSFGRKRTLIVCGLWMSIGIALFYFATNMPRLIAIQLFFGLVANAVWPIYYAMASDSAEERATSTANGIITTAMFIGGGISPLLMGWLIQFGGGWENPAGYIYAFFTMAGCALLGMLLQLMTTDKTPRKVH